MLSLVGCTVLKSHHVRDDWAAADQKAVRRLTVVVQPLPAGDPKAGETFARIARRYVNQKRDFIVKQEVSQADAVKPELLCGTDDHIEGLLFLKVALVKQGEGFEADLDASLVRCPDLREVWAAKAAGSFPAKDPLLTEVAAVYARELGPEAEPYVAPAMNVLRPALDTLPQPLLTEEDKDEKAVTE